MMSNLEPYEKNKVSLGTQFTQSCGSGHASGSRAALREKVFVPQQSDVTNFLRATASNTMGESIAGDVTLNISATTAMGATLSPNAPRIIKHQNEILDQALKPAQKQPLPTPIKIERLAYHLTGYPQHLYNTLVAGFTEGFKTHFKGDAKSQFSRNLTSATQLPQIIDCKLQKEIDLGRIKGPFNSPPLENFRVSPIGVVPKKVQNEYRIIQHLSFPEGDSINDFIPKEYTSVHYASVDDATKIIKTLGRDCAMAKCDVRSAFRIIPLHPEEYNLFGMYWREQYYYDCVLPMGCASSCQIFELFSTGLEWIARQKLGIKHIIHILDDFLIIAPSLHECQKALDHLLELCKDIGVPMADEKTEGPSHVLTFAGIELDCIKGEARLPRDKIEKCKAAINDVFRRKKVPLVQLQSLIGLLNFACKVITPGRVFLRRLINLTIGVTKPHHFIRLNQGTKQDLMIWQTFFDNFNGTSVFLDEFWLSSDTLRFYTDASKSIGFGIIFGTKWAQGRWPESWKHKDISFLELFPIVVGVILWGQDLKNQKILFLTDNQSIVYVINKQTSKDKSLLSLIRKLVLTCLQYNILFRAKHISGKRNDLADSLSRFQVNRFKSLAVNMDKTPTEIPSHLCPQNWAIF